MITYGEEYKIRNKYQILLSSTTRKYVITVTVYRLFAEGTNQLFTPKNCFILE